VDKNVFCSEIIFSQDISKFQLIEPMLICLYKVNIIGKIQYLPNYSLEVDFRLSHNRENITLKGCHK
jgi:hypothetical protein